MLAVKWPVENGRLPDDTNTKNWVRRKVIEKDGKKLFWDLALEDKSKKAILLIDMACPNEYNKIPKRGKRLGTTINYALNYENDKKVIR